MKFAQLVGRVIGKAVSVQEALAGRSTKWIAEKFDVSPSTARRWRDGKPSHAGGPPSKPRDSEKTAAVFGSVDRDQRRRIAADAMRGATSVNVGKVEVRIDTGDQHETQTRNLGIVQLGQEGQALMQQAAEAAEAGNMALADELVDRALLHSDGRDYGPCHISGYSSGFTFI